MTDISYLVPLLLYSTGTLTYAENNDRYRCSLPAIGATADAFTSNALPTVYRTHNVTAQPVNATGNEGETSSYTVAGSTSSGTQTFQWSKSDNGVDYFEIPVLQVLLTLPLL